MDQDLNVKLKTTKLLEEIRGVNPSDLAQVMIS